MLRPTTPTNQPIPKPKTPPTPTKPPLKRSDKLKSSGSFNPIAPISFDDIPFVTVTTISKNTEAKK